LKDGSDTLFHAWQRGVVIEESDKRGFVHHQAGEKVGTRRGKFQGNQRTKGSPDNVHGHEVGSRNQRREVGDILFDAALGDKSLALTVSAAIVSQHLERPSQLRHNGIPVVMIAPRTVNEDDRGARLATPFRIEPHAVDHADGHRMSLLTDVPRDVFDGDAPEGLRHQSLSDAYISTGRAAHRRSMTYQFQIKIGNLERPIRPHHCAKAHQIVKGWRNYREFRELRSARD